MQAARTDGLLAYSLYNVTSLLSHEQVRSTKRTFVELHAVNSPYNVLVYGAIVLIVA